MNSSHVCDINGVLVSGETCRVEWETIPLMFREEENHLVLKVCRWELRVAKYVVKGALFKSSVHQKSQNETRNRYIVPPESRDRREEPSKMEGWTSLITLNPSTIHFP